MPNTPPDGRERERERGFSSSSRFCVGNTEGQACGLFLWGIRQMKSPCLSSTNERHLRAATKRIAEAFSIPLINNHGTNYQCVFYLLFFLPFPSLYLPFFHYYFIVKRLLSCFLVPHSFSFSISTINANYIIQKITLLHLEMVPDRPTDNKV